MLVYHIKLAWRNLLKNRLFSLLNIGGLSAGLAVAMLIGLYVRDELSFDRFHKKSDRIFRVNYDTNIGGQEQSYAVSPAPMGPTFVREYPAVESFCRFRQMGFITIRKGDEAIEEGSSSYVDSSFFSVFSIPLLEGDPNTALKEPNTMVISEKMAQKYFGATTGVVGRTLRINEYMDRRVTGVMRNIPAQSHFHYDILFSLNTLNEGNSDVWLSNNFSTYLLLRPGASEAQFPAYFDALMQQYLIPQIEQMASISKDAFAASGDQLHYSLQNIRDIHLHSDRSAELEANSDIKYIWIFGSIALMVLLLACVNFMNLSTARSLHRAREVGVRKALGSNRSALVRQFLTESMVLTLVSFGLALSVVYMVLPAFNHFSDKNIILSLRDAPVWAGLGGLALITALVAGSYPAFFLSTFRPLETLKGHLSAAGKGTGRLRSSLVVFQFCTSVALISCVGVVQQQLAFIQHKKLGWDKEQVVMLRNTWWLQGRTLDFKARLQDIPGVERVSCADYFPTPSPRNSLAFTPVGKGVSSETMNSQLWEIDFDYLKVFGMYMQSGRWFDPRLATDSVACVINASAARMFGWADPLGHSIETFIDPQLQQKIQVKIIGVMEDFHFESLRETISPIAMIIGRGSGTMALRLSPQADMEKTIASVGQLYQNYLPGQPFNYRFLDDEFQQIYASERRIGSILGAFAGFAIFIACLGLFGLAAFMAEQRTKEIGIRKVLGASIGSVVGLLSKDFMKLVLASFIIAFPVAYYFMQQWLADFAYRIDIQWWMFAAAGVAATLVAVLTVGFQSVKAALANPVESLRSE